MLQMNVCSVGICDVEKAFSPPLLFLYYFAVCQKQTVGGGEEQRVIRGLKQGDRDTQHSILTRLANLNYATVIYN